MLYATAEFPRSHGFCNRLFPWARMELFSQRTGCRILAPRWSSWFKIGPYLRGEKDKRHYFQQCSNTGYICGCRRFALLSVFNHIPEHSALTAGGKDGKYVVVFSGYDGYFSPLSGHSSFLASRLEAIAHARIKMALRLFPDLPFIGVHIRRSDFKQAGLVISDDWYIRAIGAAKELAGNGLPVRIFTDAQPNELNTIRRAFSSVEIMPQRAALLDMLLLSKSTVLVGTSCSTFSMWASFLGGQSNIWHADKPPDEGACAVPPVLLR